MLYSKFLKSLLAAVCLCSIFACSEDEPNGGGANSDPTPNPPAVNQDAKLSVTISADGTTSNGAVFSQIDGTTFFLDYVKYKVVDSHLEIIGYDPVELPEIPKLYATVTIENAVYKTRIIGKEAFKESKMTSITLPETVTAINSYAFYSCTSLTQITFPEAVTTIGSFAFSDCTSLSQITLPEAVTSIDDYAFSGCTSLTQITLPEAVTSIGSYAFYCCTSLTQITFPEALTSIGSASFYGCTSLTQVTFLSLVRPKLTGYSSLYPFTSNPTAYVRPEALDDYRKWAYADMFSEILPIDE